MKLPGRHTMDAGLKHGRLWLLNVVLATLLLGCSGEIDSQDPISSETVALNGRVMDFESCMTTTGCQGAPGVRVSLAEHLDIVSETTTPDGAFSIHGIPADQPSLLLVSGEGEQEGYVTSLQAKPVNPNGNKVYGVEAYALKNKGGLYEGIVKEIGTSLDSGGFYLGQVLKLKETNFIALEGAKIKTTPSATVRFVQSNPWLDGSSLDVLYPQDRSTTGVFGQFVILGQMQDQTYSIEIESDQYTFSPQTVQVKANQITIGLHYSEQ